MSEQYLTFDIRKKEMKSEKRKARAILRAIAGACGAFGFGLVFAVVLTIDGCESLKMPFLVCFCGLGLILAAQIITENMKGEMKNEND